MQCEQCGHTHDGTYGSGRFCCQSCARKYAIKGMTPDKYRAVGQKARMRFNSKHPDRIRNCLDCGKLLDYRTTSGYCGLCFRHHQCISESTRVKISKANKGRNRWNIHRNQISFGEQYWMTALDINHISYIHEYQIPYDSAHHVYYMDFRIGMIDLEIDGRQHEERKEADEIRDSFMRSQGYFVYRVKWNDIKTTAGLDMMREKLHLFLSFYDELGYLFMASSNNG